MIFNVPVQVRITPSVRSKGKDREKALAGIEVFLKNFNVIIDEYEKRTLHIAKKAAPSRTGGLSDGLDTLSANSGFSLVSNPDGYDEEDGYWMIGSKTRGIMMEFGYPYSNYWGPYLPNPRPGTVSQQARTSTVRDKKSKVTGAIKTVKRGAKKGLEQFYGLGFMRISYIVAARSLHQQAVSYSTSGLTLSDVKSYVKRSEEEFTGSMKKLLLKFLRNKGLPAYLKRKSVPKAPSPMKLKTFVKYGEVEGLTLNIPINIQGDAYYNSMRRGDNLRNATQSLNQGRPFVSGFEFATDDSSLPALPF